MLVTLKVMPLWLMLTAGANLEAEMLTSVRSCGTTTVDEGEGAPVPL